MTAVMGGARAPPDGSRAPGLLSAVRGALAGEERLVLAVALLLQLVGRDEAQRGRVEAVAEAGRLRPVGEHVAEVGAGVLRADLGAEDPEGDVASLLHVRLIERLREAGPARPRVELVERGEERLPRDHVHVDAGGVVVPVIVLERPLGGAL